MTDSASVQPNLAVLGGSGWVVNPNYGQDGSIINATDRYGIVNSSTADQTARLQNMAADVLARKIGSIIQLPPGEIHVTSAIDITGGADELSWINSTVASTVKHPTLQGAGVGNTNIYQDTAGQALFRVYKRSGYAIGHGFGLKHMSLIGPSNSNTGSCALQMGGVSAGQSDIGELSDIDSVLFRNWYAGIRLDDFTQFRGKRLQFQGVEWSFQFGYNIDDFLCEQSFFGDVSTPVAWAGTCTNGLATITGISPAVVAKMKVGMIVVDETSLPTVNFALLTRIVSIDSTTQVTVSNNYAGGTGAKTLTCVFGAVLSCVSAAFPDGWTLPFNTPGGGNGIRFANCHHFALNVYLQNRISNNSQIKWDTCYFERPYRGWLPVADGGDSGGIRNLTLENSHFGNLANVAQELIKCDYFSNQNHDIRIINNRHDDASGPRFPWLVLPAGGYASLEWSQNRLLAGAGTSPIYYGTGGTAMSPIEGQEIIVNGGFSADGDLRRRWTRGGTGLVRSLGNQTSAISWDPWGLNEFHFTVNHATAVVVNNPNTSPGDGMELNFVITQGATAGSVTFGTDFVTADGATRVGAAGVYAAGTTGQKRIWKYRHNGSKFVLLHEQTAWV